MEPIRNTLVVPTLALALLALPAAASAESEVPPENSAATQYTEAIPTGGGQSDASKPGHHEKRSPSSVLGSHKAQKLNAQGPQGQAAAEVAAATAPITVQPVPASEPATEAKPATQPRHHEAKSQKQGAAKGGGAQDNRTAPRHESNPPPRLTIPSGSSAASEIFAQATGSSSDGELGLWLPLLILATIVWSLFYLRRRKQPV